MNMCEKYNHWEVLHTHILDRLETVKHSAILLELEVLDFVESWGKWLKQGMNDGVQVRDSLREIESANEQK